MKAFGITADLNKLPELNIDMPIYKEIFEHTAENMGIAWGALLLMTVVCYAVSYISMRVKKL